MISSMIPRDRHEIGSLNVSPGARLKSPSVVVDDDNDDSGGGDDDDDADDDDDDVVFLPRLEKMPWSIKTRPATKHIVDLSGRVAHAWRQAGAA